MMPLLLFCKFFESFPFINLYTDFAKDKGQYFEENRDFLALAGKKIGHATIACPAFSFLWSVNVLFI
ncbi:hypothetical protein ACZ11_09925 [Lysinibacillus xylanilyticus]|uniref:Uncharacterized protein n=1 Tax=Lysinibacillus xylanilyticus TaxID=582475 RepID=A0A0K9FD77_9BACI|nr:hypothetical protein ACZ11_09925 [Lysinibacillus xylanilyticus]